MHNRPHPKGYMRLVTPVLPWKIKNSTLYKKVFSGKYEVCTVYINKILGAYNKRIYCGQEGKYKAELVLKPFKDEYGHNRTCTRFRKDEKYYNEDVKEIFDCDYYQTSHDAIWVYIALRNLNDKQ